MVIFAIPFVREAQAQANLEVKQARWEFGTSTSYGFAPGNGSRGDFSTAVDLHFSNIQGSAGRLICRACERSRFRTEALVEIIPFWRASYPRQTHSVFIEAAPNQVTQTTFGPFSRQGVSITPLLVRVLFGHAGDRRVEPWVQAGGGLLWTNHKFPILVSSPTSVINFTPQVGVGLNLYTRPRESLQLGLKVIHISNAGLGDNNAGVNVSLHFTAGYSWWR